jgi:para-nitrobenzyl esterase
METMKSSTLRRVIQTVLAVSSVTAAHSSRLIVSTQSGLVQGAIEADIRVFRGIPFAAPPVGDLRWRPSAPPIPWTGIRDASTFGNVCPQLDAIFSGNFIGNEDCLFLNIYSAANLAWGSEQPVMVFFHGGGDVAGSTQDAPFGSPPLATHGVIVVTAEYRLGALGSFTHPKLAVEGHGSAGNYGLMDQIAALAWVRRNIRAFGGDPERVMAFGQSAGAADVQALLTSPAARGLFSRAGIESDAIAQKETRPLEVVEAAQAPLVALVGCDNNAPDVLACLRTVPASVLVTNQFAVPAADFVLEPRVLPEDPFAFLQRHGSPVPLLIGSNSEEATGLGLTFDPSLTAAQYPQAVQANFGFLGQSVVDQILAVYPSSAYDAPFWALVAAYSDFNITCVVRNAARAAIGRSREDESDENEHAIVWRYLFTHRIENDPNLNALRAFHTEELFFLFGHLEQLGNPYVPSSDELRLSQLVMDYWTRFAATGNPNGPAVFHWPRYSAHDRILQLDVTPGRVRGYHNPQCDFFTPVIDSFCSTNICTP